MSKYVEALSFYETRCAQLEQQRDELLAALYEAINQVEHLHDKFQETGTGSSFIVRTQILIAKCEATK